MALKVFWKALRLSENANSLARFRMNIASDNFCLKYLVHIYETGGWLACWSSVSYIIGPPYLAQARRALTWLGQRLNNKTDSKRSSPIYFASSHLRIKFSNSWWGILTLVAIVWLVPIVCFSHWNFCISIFISTAQEISMIMH